MCTLYSGYGSAECVSFPLKNVKSLLKHRAPHVTIAGWNPAVRRQYWFIHGIEPVLSTTPLREMDTNFTFSMYPKRIYWLMKVFMLSSYFFLCGNATCWHPHEPRMIVFIPWDLCIQPSAIRWRVQKDRALAFINGIKRRFPCPYCSKEKWFKEIIWYLTSVLGRNNGWKIVSPPSLTRKA